MLTAGENIFLLRTDKAPFGAEEMLDSPTPEPQNQTIPYHLATLATPLSLHTFYAEVFTIHTGIIIPQVQIFRHTLE